MSVLKLKPLSMIAAVAKNKVIGNKGQLPWRVPEDLKFFKTMTTGHAIVMGKKTYDSTGRPLANRRNIVVSRSAVSIEGAEVCGSIDEAIARARETDPEPFIIGGAEIYRLAMPLATRIYITEIDQSPDGDAHFPDFAHDQDGAEWKETERRAAETAGVTFVTYERIAS